ncbi:MAG: NAD-dependent DNA ligase LigA [Patescibacteria group bacterium]|nr:NAD-dependent DNA ligase LigA [Patescibacteria group bacterium]
MNEQQIKQRIEKLKKEINYHSYFYHILDKPKISDAVWDNLKKELSDLEKSYPQFITIDSPTQRVSGRPLDKFKKVEHQVRQWSFNDIFDKNELIDFDQKLKTMLTKKGIKKDELEYACELKIDGVHIVLTYKNGIFTQALTRGDGKIGEDVTHNIKTIQSIPLCLNKNISVIVEGEIWIGNEAFEKLNKKRRDKGLNEFANPRNAAAGSIRQLDAKIAASRKLDCFLYDLAKTENKFPESQYNELKFLRNIGFKVNRHYKLCRGVKDIIAYWEYWKTHAKKQDYWIDGVVVKLNSRKYQKMLGYTGKAPRWAIAFKFPAEQATTIIKNIAIQVGRTGTLTPVAYLRPVKVAGSIISRATLHNEDEIKKLDVRIGDTVIIQKAGDIIPEIIEPIISLRSGDEKKFIMPKFCPVCDSPVYRKNGEAATYCSNKKCYAQEKEKLIHFVSKKGFDIDGFGKKIVEQLLSDGLISIFSDFFNLTKGDLEPLERFAEKSAENLIQAIKNSKNIKANKFFFALGIRYAGEETAILLAKQLTDDNFNGIIKILKAINYFKKFQISDFEKIEGIGEKSAKSLFDYFHNSVNLQELKKLDEIGVKIILPQLKSKEQKLAKKTFVLTGALPNLNREEAKEKIRKMGGNISSSVSNKTDYILIGDNPGKKYQEAKTLKIKIIKENEFLKMIK